MEILQKFKIKNIIPLVSLILVIILSYIAYNKKNIQAIDHETYISYLENNLFKSATILNDEVILKSDEDTYFIDKDIINFEELLAKVPIRLKYNDESILNFIVLIILFIFIFLNYFLTKKESYSTDKINSINAQTKQFYKMVKSIQKTDITFKDVAGIDEIEGELNEIINFLKDPKKYKKFGIKLPRGVLLIGPPGVGKTLIAKAVAGEAGIPFFYQSGASFVHIYVGMGAKRVKELFANAKRESPSIIFIDEIDAIGKARGNLNQNDEREATLNQLLIEMDGFEDNSNVMVIAATNQIEVLDEALLRSGRFDRRVFIPLPNLLEREDILRVYIKDKKHSVDIKEVAKMCIGFSGAALATLVNEAAIHTLNRGAESITIDDFDAVKDKVLLGKKKAIVYTPQEKQIQATYQAAKALSAYWYEINFDKISILGGELIGEDSEFESKTKLLSKIKVYLSGKVATKIVYNESYSNSLVDLEKAKCIAEEIVEKFAMGRDIISTDNNNVLTILNEAMQDVETFLYKMKATIKKIEEKLLKDEFITQEGLKSIVDEVL